MPIACLLLPPRMCHVAAVRAGRFRLPSFLSAAEPCRKPQAPYTPLTRGQLRTLHVKRLTGTSLRKRHPLVLSPPPAGLKPPRGARARRMSYAGEGEGEGDGAGSGAAGRTAFRVAEKRFKLVKEDTGQRRRRRGQQRGQGSDAAAGKGGSAEGALAGAVDFRELEKRFQAAGQLADTAAPAATATTAAAGASAGAGEAACVAAVAVSSIVREEGAAGLPCPVYTVQGRPGFFFLPGALTVQQQAELVQEALQRSVEPPNRTNHTAAFGAIHGLWPAFAHSCAASDHGSTEHGDDDGGGGGGGSSSSRSRRRISAVLRPCVGGGEAEGIECAGERGMGGEAREWGGENGWRGIADGACCFEFQEQGEEEERGKGRGEKGRGKGWSGEGRDRASEVMEGGRGEGAGAVMKSGEEGERNGGEGRCVGGEAVGGGCERGVSAEWLVGKLRWATLGVQFDWSKRAYDPSLPFRPFPTFLAHLASRLAAPAMPSAHATFSPEAAIVNFYHPGLPPRLPLPPASVPPLLAQS
ncbi:unnamed protein product [Closterium sp. NIES-54]